MNVVFLTPPEVHLLDLSGPAHIFYEAVDYGADIDLHFVTIGESSVRSSSGLAFTDLKQYADIQLGKGDYLFVPGIEKRLLLNEQFLESCRPFFSWMNEQYENGVAICSVCTGAFLVAESGLLNGLKCTTHWKYYNRFIQRFPQVNLLNNRLFVEDSRIYSSAGVSSGIDLVLYLLEKDFGTKLASDIAREVVVYLRRSEDDPQLSMFLKYRNHQEDRVHEAQNWLSQHLSKNISVDELADMVSTSPRNLTRLFKKTTGITIGEYIEKLRIERAIKLLNDGNKVDSVASACGLRSTNQLRTIINKHTGMLPHNFQ